MSNCFIILLLFLHAAIGSGREYGMYVWRTGWDPSVSGCDTTAFLKWDRNSPCFTHTWATPSAREWLWSTCARADRPITKLFLYDTQSPLATRNCDSQEVRNIRQTMREGHERIRGLRIHALFSDGGDNVPESQHVPNVVWYNGNCADYSQGEQIDGVAVNNENWDRDWDAGKMREYLDAVDKIRENAGEQMEPLPKLETHFSVGWVWGRRAKKGRQDEDIMLEWRGKEQPAMRHFVDIFDRLDVQVAFITADAMEERLMVAEWEYAAAQGKRLMTTVYINKDDVCQSTFFPFSINEADCPSWSHEYKNEIEMFKELDDLEGRLQTGIVLHHFRGAYSAGVDTLGWPRH